MKEFKQFNYRIPIELWTEIDQVWARTRAKETGLTKEDFLVRVLKAGLKAEGEK